MSGKWFQSIAPSRPPAGGINTGVAHPARVYAAAGAAGAKQYNSFVATPQTRRDRAAVTAFFGGLDLVEPGLVQAHQWRPDPGSAPVGSISAWAGVARKPRAHGRVSTAGSARPAGRIGDAPGGQLRSPVR